MGIINGMMRYRQVDEIILYTILVIAGNGSHLFQSELPEGIWSCGEVESYKNEVIKAVYKRRKGTGTADKGMSLSSKGWRNYFLRDNVL